MRVMIRGRLHNGVSSRPLLFLLFYTPAAKERIACKKLEKFTRRTALESFALLSYALLYAWFASFW